MSNEDIDQMSEILKKIMDPKRTILYGDDRNHVILLVRFFEPVVRSNNQRISTDHYIINDKGYDLHYGVFQDPDLDPMVEEIEIENPDKY